LRLLQSFLLRNDDIRLKRPAADNELYLSGMILYCPLHCSCIYRVIAMPMSFTNREKQSLAAGNQRLAALIHPSSLIDNPYLAQIGF